MNMNRNYKVLTVSRKLRKSKMHTGTISIEDMIEKAAPGVYSFFKTDVDAIGKDLNAVSPDIVWIYNEKKMDVVAIVARIKNENPRAVVFLFCFEAIDNEQDIDNYYQSIGVYRCFFIPPLFVDSLLHDMYVAVNLE